MDPATGTREKRLRPCSYYGVMDHETGSAPAYRPPSLCYVPHQGVARKPTLHNLLPRRRLTSPARIYLTFSAFLVRAVCHLTTLLHTTLARVTLYDIISSTDQCKRTNRNDLWAKLST